MLVNNAYANHPLHNLKYTSQAVATPLSSIVDKPSACAGFFIMQLTLEFSVNRWKDISGYEDIYQVSKNGQVKSFHKNSIRILAQKTDKYGYLIVGLYYKKQRKHIGVHRLVALAFIPNPQNKPEVNHLDGDKTNNNDWNLEWATTAENIQHAFNTGIKVGPSGKNHRRSKPIDMFDLNGNYIRSFESMNIASNQTNNPLSAIWQVCAKKPGHHTAGGFKWAYSVIPELYEITA